MSLPKLAAIVVAAVVAVILVATIAVYVLWSSGEDPPTPNEPVTTLRR